ncbi:unnamed protein product [Heterobilharzia americana]|nr:unnamed protein product [Heterobilharzia americana]
MQDPNADTEWNDILRQKGILPPKKTEPPEELPVPPDPKSILDNLTSEELEENDQSRLDNRITNAGDMFVVVHIGEKGNTLCSLIDDHFRKLAPKFPSVKFLRGESSLCIPNYPSNNLPSILVYKAGDLKEQLIGPDAVGGNTVTLKKLEWRLAQLGILESKLTKDPSKRIKIKVANSNHIKRIAGESSGDDDINNSDSEDD